MNNAANRHKVLVIDDELGPRESLRMLMKFEFDVVCVDCVDAGIEALKEHRPEVIVQDIKMPGKDGIQGLREIRDIDKHVSVIMLTGFGTLESAQDALRLGANDYLKKPFDTNEMMLVLKHHAQRTSVLRRRNAAEEGLKDLNGRLMNELEEKEQMASLGQASAEFLHDLRNPLTIVLGYVQLLSEQLVSSRETLGGEFGETVEYLDVIEKNVQRCNEMAQMWQNYGKEDMSKKAPIVLGELLEEIVKSAQTLASGQRAVLEGKFTQNGASVMGSKPQMLRAIHNIVANAIQAVPEKGGRVVVECKTSGERALVTIEDNGCGMTPEQSRRVFDAYFTTKEKGKGTGLGLHIAKKIVEEHGGDIKVQSAPAQGTRVFIELPLMQPGAQASVGVSQAATASP